MDLESPIYQPFVQLVNEGYNRVKRADTELCLKSLVKGLDRLEQLAYPGLRYLNDAEVLKSMIGVEQEGFDGVVVSCFFDPALKPARQMLNIPVVGIAEASMHLAMMMGRQFAVVTSEAAYIDGINETIEAYGMRENVIARKPVRAITLSCTEFLGCLAGNLKPAIESFQEIAKECIEDGAEVIIAGCGLLSPMLTSSKIVQVDGASIVDPMLIGIKYCEILVDLYKAGVPVISRKGKYLKTPTEEIASIFKT